MVRNYTSCYLTEFLGVREDRVGHFSGEVWPSGPSYFGLRRPKMSPTSLDGSVTSKIFYFLIGFVLAFQGNTNRVPNLGRTPDKGSHLEGHS